ncbi:hypothetical protein LXL04_011949 [Taraxacum kok-saghyz]
MVVTVGLVFSYIHSVSISKASTKNSRSHSISSTKNSRSHSIGLNSVQERTRFWLVCAYCEEGFGGFDFDEIGGFAGTTDELCLDFLHPTFSALVSRFNSFMVPFIFHKLKSKYIRRNVAQISKSEKFTHSHVSQSISDSKVSFLNIATRTSNNSRFILYITDHRIFKHKFVSISIETVRRDNCLLVKNPEPSEGRELESELERLESELERHNRVTQKRMNALIYREFIEEEVKDKQGYLASFEDLYKEIL